jgi:hypothetical protein
VEEACSTATLINFYQTIWCRSPGDFILSVHCCRNLSSPISAIDCTLDGSSETYLWVVLCEVIQFNSPKTIVSIRQWTTDV